MIEGEQTFISANFEASVVSETFSNQKHTNILSALVSFENKHLNTQQPSTAFNGAFDE